MEKPLYINFFTYIFRNFSRTFSWFPEYTKYLNFKKINDRIFTSNRVNYSSWMKVISRYLLIEYATYVPMQRIHTITHSDYICVINLRVSHIHLKQGNRALKKKKWKNLLDDCWSVVHIRSCRNYLCHDINDIKYSWVVA